MSDTLEKMKEQLLAAEADYQLLKKHYTSVESLGGVVITALEKENLGYIKDAIRKLKADIKKREELLSRIDLQGVFMEYDNLLDRVNSFYKQVNQTYKIWRNHIYSVGTCYSNAYDNYKDTVAKQKKYKDDLANIAGSIISVAGVGTLSWLSTTGKIVKLLGNRYKDAVNIGEDVAQGLWDKTVSFAAGKMSSVQKIDLKGPIVFQNTISKKALEGCLGVLNTVLKCEGIVIECKVRISKLRQGSGGTIKGSPAAKKQYENFLKVQDSIAKTMEPVMTWIKKMPPKINAKELQDDLERGFWAKWLPKLHKHTPAHYKKSYDHGLGTVPYKVEASDSYDAWMSTALANRLTALVDLPGIGVGKNGLDYWVSQNDVKLLVGWARSFKSTQKF